MKDHEIRIVRKRGGRVRYLVMEVLGPDEQRAATGILHKTEQDAQDEINLLESNVDPFARF